MLAKCLLLLPPLFALQAGAAEPGDARKRSPDQRDALLAAVSKEGAGAVKEQLRALLENFAIDFYIAKRREPSDKAAEVLGATSPVFPECFLGLLEKRSENDLVLAAALEVLYRDWKNLDSDARDRLWRTLDPL